MGTQAFGISLAVVGASVPHRGDAPRRGGVVDRGPGLDRRAVATSPQAGPERVVARVDDGRGPGLLEEVVAASSVRGALGVVVLLCMHHE